MSFSEADLTALLDETLTLLERNPHVDGRYRIERSFADGIRAGPNRSEPDQTSLLESLRQRAAAMPAGGVLTVASSSPLSGCASGFAIQAWVSTRGQQRENLRTAAIHILRAAPGWVWPLSIKSCRRTAGRIMWSPSRIAGRNLRWNCREWRERFT